MRRSALLHDALSGTLPPVARKKTIVSATELGKARAGYGETLIDRRAQDLTARFGRGFGRRNLFQMRAFYLAYREIVQTTSAQSGASPGARIVQTVVPTQKSIGGVATTALGPSCSSACVTARAEP